MPREQLLGLAHDVDRLLAAGASAAAGNEALRRRARTLRDLGQKVAALNPIAEAVDKVVEASPRQVAPAFLDLVRIVRQVRGNLATTGLEGPLEPLEERAAWQTPLSVHEVYPLGEALAGSGSGREEILRDAVERKATADLRLSGALLQAQADGYAPVAELVTTSALPALGKAILPDLERSLDLQGKVVDARRLRSICLIDPKVGHAYCRKALAEGSPAMKVAALECLADVAPAPEAEKLGLEMSEDKNGEVRAAALSALRVGRSDAALDRVLEKTRDRSEEVQAAAFQVLQKVQHPQTTPRLLAQLEEILSNLTVVPRAPKEVKGAKGARTKAVKAAAGKAKGPTEKEKAAAERARQLRHAARLIEVLGGREDEHQASAARALLPLVEHKEEAISTTALRQLGRVGAAVPEVVPTLVGYAGGKKKNLVQIAVDSLAELPPKQREPAFAVLSGLAKDPKTPAHLRTCALRTLPGFVDGHQKDVLAILKACLKDRENAVVQTAMAAVGEIGPPARELLQDALEAALKPTSGYYYYSYLWRNVNPFLSLDPEGTTVIPYLTEVLQKKKGQLRGTIVMLLGGYGPRARSAIPAIAEVAGDDKADHYIRHWAEDALRKIDQ